MDQKRFLGLMDMIDGGGMGRSGQTFEGGPFSGLMNALGIRPAGYMDRLEEARPMPRPVTARPALAGPANPMAGKSTEELVAMIEAALARSGYADTQKNVYAPGAITTTPLMESNSPNRFPPPYFGMGPR